MLNVALTGNIASGKSSVVRLFHDWGATIIDAATVQVAAQATLAALFRRERTGLGETIRVSLREVALNLQLPNWSDYLVRGVEPTRSGDGQPMNAPAADIFRTRDGMVVISAYVQSHWVRLWTQRRSPFSTVAFNTVC